MTSLQVFDPALCCSTGVCGAEVDEALIGFAADVEWAQTHGAKIQRFNLSQQPMAFADNVAVKAALQHGGEAVLPMLVLDGEVAMSGRYPSRAELSQWLGLDQRLLQASSGAAAPTAINPKVIAVAAAPASGCCGPVAAAAPSAAPGASKCC